MSCIASAISCQPLQACSLTASPSRVAESCCSISAQPVCWNQLKSTTAKNLHMSSSSARYHTKILLVPYLAAKVRLLGA